ncbi:MAG: hypothetical protein ABIB71_02570 [Candidatus Woesearchaeota archaeon]
MDLGTIIETIKEMPQIAPYALSALGAGIALYSSIRHEMKKTRRIPLAYSEIRQIELEARERGEKLGDITKFLTSTNDLCMQVFDAYNESYTGKFAMSPRGLGSSLAQKYSRSTQGSTLKELLSNSVTNAKQLKKNLSIHIKVLKELNKISSSLNSAWSESHVDHYRTEVYMAVETYTDAKGNSHVKVVPRTRQVYDHTEHTYQYDKSSGIEAANNLKDMFKQIPKLSPIEKIATAGKVSLEGKEAARKSRGENSKLSEEDFLRISNMWCNGTRHDDNLELVVGEYSGLENEAAAWDTAKDTAQAYYHYITHSTTDSGPRQYRVAKQTLHTAQSIAGRIGGTVNAINLVMGKVPELETSLEDYLRLTLERIKDKKEEKRLKENIMEETKGMYSSIFSEGIDMDRFKEWKVALWTAAGAGSGLGLGYLVDYLSSLG